MPNVVFRSELKKGSVKRQLHPDDNWPETVFIFVLAFLILLLLAFGTFA